MSERPIDVVRLLFAVHGFPIPDSTGALAVVPEGFDVLDLFADDFELTCMPGTLLGGVWRGRTAFFDTGAALTSRFKIDTTEVQLHDAGNQVFLTCVNRYTELHSGEAVNMPCVEGYTVKSGKICVLTVYYLDTT